MYITKAELEAILNEITVSLVVLLMLDIDSEEDIEVGSALHNTACGRHRRPEIVDREPRPTKTTRIELRALPNQEEESMRQQK